jgi:hypothetical protein
MMYGRMDPVSNGALRFYVLSYKGVQYRLGTLNNTTPMRFSTIQSMVSGQEVGPDAEVRSALVGEAKKVDDWVD